MNGLLQAALDAHASVDPPAVRAAVEQAAADLLRCRRARIAEWPPADDGLGHAAGNEVLRQVAHRLERHSRAGDTVARMGGDEFVVCAPGLRSPDEASGLAERLLGAFAAPFIVDRRELFVSPSIGVALH